ncbi:MAG: 50S ribosomal protein L15e [archaeon]|nr:50S ribosomal protein L15e [Candidatus Micrarchaeota archaeon]
MSYLKSVKEVFQKEFAGKKDEFYDYKKIQSDRLIEYRKEKNAIVKLERPTNLSRARELGYKAKQGLVVVRVRIRKGTGLKRRPSRARRPKRMGVKKLTRRKSIQAIAEIRASKKYRNLEVLSSYWIGEDGKHKYFEVILVDPQHPVIKSDKELNWICERGQKGRAERGLTSAGKKSRGLTRRRSAEKVRPSRRAHDRKA